MTLITRLLTILALLSLAGCGGGGSNAGDPPFGEGGPSTTPVYASELSISAPATITNNGSDSVDVVVTALTAARVALPGATVAVAVDNGGILTPQGDATVTGADGTIKATLTVGSDPTLRSLTITAASGDARATQVVQVVTAPGTTAPASIDVVASKPEVGTGGDPVTITAFVKDANNVTLPGTTVSFITDTGTLASVSATTDSSGVATATFSAGSDRSNRKATIRVTAGTVTEPLELPIAGTTLKVSGADSLVLGATSVYSVVATDSNGDPVDKMPIAASSLLGSKLVATGDGTTDANGKVEFQYTAEHSGSDTLTFSGLGASTPKAVSVDAADFAFIDPGPTKVGQHVALKVRYLVAGVAQPGKTIEFVATGGTVSPTSTTTDSAGIATVDLSSSSAGPVTVEAKLAVSSSTSATLTLMVVADHPSRLVLQLARTAVAPGGTTEVSARVVDAFDNPVQGTTVNFTRAVDPSGGSLSKASEITDASGTASVTYTAGGSVTANDGVRLTATVASDPSITDDATLTVSQQALFIGLGTGNVIENLDETTYKKVWTVYVTDANGVAVPNVTLTLSALPTRYRKGHLVFTTAWVYAADVQTCDNEDLDHDGVLDDTGAPPPEGEDDNQDGKLEPGNVVTVTPGSVKTDEAGRVNFELHYAESYVPWVEIELRATAEVAGTESSNQVTFFIDGMASDFTDQNNPPAAVVSPFGIESCDRPN